MLVKIRLGDLIDDYCPRCRLLLDHNVASLVGEQVAKVVCRTCYNEHPYRGGKSPKKKKDVKQTLLDEILARAPAPSSPSQPPSAARPRTPHLRQKS